MEGEINSTLGVGDCWGYFDDSYGLNEKGKH